MHAKGVSGVHPRRPDYRLLLKQLEKAIVHRNVLFDTITHFAAIACVENTHLSYAIGYKVLLKVRNGYSICLQVQLRKDSKNCNQTLRFQSKIHPWDDESWNWRSVEDQNDYHTWLLKKRAQWFAGYCR